MPEDEQKSRALFGAEKGLTILLAWWAVPFTLVGFWIRFIPSHDWITTALHVLLVAVCATFGAYSYRAAVCTLSGAMRKPELAVWWQSGAYWLIPLVVVLTGTLSLNAGLNPARREIIAEHHSSPLLRIVRAIPGYRTYVDIREAEISTKPSYWTGRETSLDGVKGVDLRGRDFRQARASDAFMAKARLDRADFSGADLSGLPRPTVR
jgi:hypothetical protein